MSSTAAPSSASTAVPTHPFAYASESFREAFSLLETLDALDRRFEKAHTQYKASAEARGVTTSSIAPRGSSVGAHRVVSGGTAVAPAGADAPSSAVQHAHAGARVSTALGASAVRAHAAGTTLSLADSLRDLDGIAGAPAAEASTSAGGTSHAHTYTTKRSLEQARDPRLLKTPLLASLHDVREGKPFFARVPDFAFDMRRGNNAIALEAELARLDGLDRVYMAVNVLNASEYDALQAGNTARRSVLSHVCLRWDAAAAAIGARARIRKRIVLGFRLASNWTVTVKDFKDEGDFPVDVGERFWLRLVAHPAGFALFINSVYVGFARHAPSAQPHEGDTLMLELPTSGDKGERSTWRAHSLWAGGVALEPEVQAAIASELASNNVAIPVLSPDEVRLTGVPDGATAEELRGVLLARGHGIVGVRLLGGAAAIATLAAPDAAAMTRILNDMQTSPLMLRGARLFASQAFRTSAAPAVTHTHAHTGGTLRVPGGTTPGGASLVAPRSAAYNPTSPRY